MSARDRQMVAFHEAGHAVLAYVLLLDQQIQVASILKRRDTLGVVYHTPIEETHTNLREDMRRDIVVSLGGMAAEEIWFGDTTGGPGSDLANATYRAAVMLGFLGMGDSLIAYSLLGDNPYTGGSIQAILEDPKNREAMRNLLMGCKHDAVELLRRNEPAIRALAERLLELLGQDWHQPALVEARPSPSHDPLERQPNVEGGNGEVHPSAPAPSVPPAPPTGGRAVNPPPPTRRE